MTFPRFNCRTTTATVLTATATVTYFVRVLCFLLSHLLSQVHRRQKQLSDFVEMKKYWTLPKSCGSQSSEWEERKKSGAKRGSLCNVARQSHGFRFICKFFFKKKILCEPAIIAAAGRRLWRRPESNAAGAHVFNVMSCPPRLSQGLFFCILVNRFFFLTLGLHPVLLSSSTCDGLLFRAFIKVCMVHLIVTDVPVPQVVEEIVEVIKVIPRERCPSASWSTLSMFPFRKSWRRSLKWLHPTTHR